MPEGAVTSFTLISSTLHLHGLIARNHVSFSLLFFVLIIVLIDEIHTAVNNRQAGGHGHTWFAAERRPLNIGRLSIAWKVVIICVNCMVRAAVTTAILPQNSSMLLRIREGSLTFTIESRSNGTITVSRMNFSEYVGHVTVFCRTFTIAYCLGLLVELWLFGGVAQWSGRRSVAGRISLIYACSMVDVWPLCGKGVRYGSTN